MLMRRRLYFLLPDVESARGMLNDMLLARIGESHVRFLARRGALSADLPEASVLQKTDFVHGAQLGIALGGVLGAAGGLMLMLFPPGGMAVAPVAVLAGGLFGALFGAWASSLVGAAVPNTKLRPFYGEIERGRVLMMVDVPMRRVQEISALVAQRHPEAAACGFEPTIPAFP